VSGETDAAPPPGETGSELDPRDREFLDYLIELTWSDLLARLRKPPSNDNR
jgi:hypothetical protein